MRWDGKREAVCVQDAHHRRHVISRGDRGNRAWCGAVVPRRQLKRPSVTGGGRSLYMQAPPSLEEKTRPNLPKPLRDLVTPGERLRVTDPALPFYIQLELTLE